MIYYRITNLVTQNGQCDYKSLNVDKIIGGTQVYPHDFSISNICLVGSSEDLPSNGDLSQITESEYNTLKQEIISAYPPSPQDKIATLETQVASLQTSLLSAQDAINSLLGV